jgi:hypothetical protein
LRSGRGRGECRAKAADQGVQPFGQAGDIDIRLPARRVRSDDATRRDACDALQRLLKTRRGISRFVDLRDPCPPAEPMACDSSRRGFDGQA